MIKLLMLLILLVGISMIIWAIVSYLEAPRTKPVARPDYTPGSEKKTPKPEKKIYI